jgi:hypothetical protein
LIRDFRPPADGSLAPARIEAFLSIREGLGDARARLEDGFGRIDAIESGRGSRSPANIFRAIKSGVGLFPEVFASLERRNELLLEVEMGLGEYIYFYCVSYYNLLGKSPSDGPRYVVLGDDDSEDEDFDEEQVRQWRKERITRFLNSRIGSMLRHQRAALRESDRRQELSELAQRLDAEIAALEEDPLRLPWNGGLPDAMLASLRPYRDRLEATYGEMTNCIDLGPSGQE